MQQIDGGIVDFPRIFNRAIVHWKIRYSFAQSSAMTALNKEFQSLLLPTGRTLAFAEFGKPNGRPVIYFHGFPMCRLEASALDTPARRANIRLIAPDRPGIGQSSFTPRRSILDHAEDVRVLSQHLGIPKFAILGVSGGTPYTLACASALPKEMLIGVGILSGMGTYEKSDLALVPMASKIVGWLARNAPRVLTIITNISVASLKHIVEWKWFQKKIEEAVENAKKSKNQWEKDVIGTSDQDDSNDRWTATGSRERLLKAIFEPFRQGSKGVVQEAALVSQPWGFKLEEIMYPVKIWHGKKDINAPIEWMQAMSKRITNAEMHEFEEETHGGVIKHLDTIFTELLEKDTTKTYNDDSLRKRT